MLNYSGEMPLVCVIYVSTKDINWTTWNSENLRKIESHIEYDLNFDGYKVQITRMSKPSRALCSKPFMWQLEIDVDHDEEREADLVRESIGSRFKVARSDASVKAIQRNIEKVFGLPRGSVCLLTPEDKKSRPSSTIKRLRNRWKSG